MPIVKGLFSVLYNKVSRVGATGLFVEEAEGMALVNPDTSKIPIWRRRPTRLEHPITAWRCWGIRKMRVEYGEDFNGWALTSVAADCLWEGPVIRAHKRPVDPKYWDAKRCVSKDEYYEEMHDTFELAGIHALKHREQAFEAALMYQVSCYGKVQLWGRVAQFKLGFRAEACIVKELWFIPTLHELFNKRNDMRDPEKIQTFEKEVAHDLENRYGCEVHLP